MHPEGIVRHAGRVILIATVGLLPLFFLPFTQDMFWFNKWIFLLTGTVLVAVLSLSEGLIKKSLSFSFSPFATGLGALCLAGLISVAVVSRNRVEALIAPLGPVTPGLFSLLVMLGQPLLTQKWHRALRWLSFAAAGFAGLIAVYQAAGLGKIMFGADSFLSGNLFTPLGSSYALLTFLAVMLPLLIEETVTSLKKNNDMQAGIASILTLLTVVGIIISSYHIMRGKVPTELPLSVAWSVAVEGLKNPKIALTGIGTENYLTTFTKGRQVTMNIGPLWNARFPASSSFLLHILSTWGILGLIGFFLLVKGMASTKDKPATLVSFIVGVGALLLAPPSIITLSALTAVALIADRNESHTPITFTKHWGLALTTVLAVFAGLIVLVVFVGKLYAAEILFFQSTLSAAKNDGTKTYNLQRQTIALSPYITRFHIAYSQTNFSIANVLAGQTRGENGKATPLSDRDRQLTISLIQQAIREAKQAVALAPENILAWENLARLYRNLMPAVAGADQWAIASYQRATFIDPTNPVLRLELGGAFLDAKDARQAEQQLMAAVALKADYANAYYNLANIYRLSGQTDNAIAALERTLTLLTPGSTDAVRAENELKDLKAAKTAPRQATNEPQPPVQQESAPASPSGIILPESSGPSGL